MKTERFRITWAVARWEFHRFFKLRDMLKGMLYMVLFGLLGSAVSTWLARDSATVPDVAVADYGGFDPQRFTPDGIRFLDHTSTSADELQGLLERGEIDGVLRIHSIDSAEILLPSERAWSTLLGRFLNELHTERQLRLHQIDEDIYAAIQAGLTLDRTFARGGTATVGDKVVAGLAIALLLMAVIMGFAYQFSAITAEKQQRITEQVVSAISPQIWIDGKILGITGIGLAYVVAYGALGVAGASVLAAFGSPVGAALSLIHPGLVLTFLLLALVGVLMWNSFLAGLAAMIDDPNTSNWTSWMLLPVLPVGFAFFTLVNPDMLSIRVLGVFPLTSSAVLPARMVLTQVEWWEPVLALALLAGTAWVFRKAAGKIFATGMMTYGKEPAFREMLDWLRRA